MKKSKPKSKKRTALRHVANTAAGVTGRAFKALIIAAMCLWAVVNVKVEYDGSRAFKQAEKATKTWVGKTVESVSKAFDIAKAIR